MRVLLQIACMGIGCGFLIVGGNVGENNNGLFTIMFVSGLVLIAAPLLYSILKESETVE